MGGKNQFQEHKKKREFLSGSIMAENTKDTGENLPLDERLVHKNWKTRLGAYEELERIFKELGDADPKFEPYRTILFF